MSTPSTVSAQQSLATVGPLRIVAKEMESLVDNMIQLLGSGNHPSLDLAARYYTQAEGKRMRPAIVLLMSAAVSKCPKKQRPWKDSLMIRSVVDSSLLSNNIIDGQYASLTGTMLTSSPPQSTSSQVASSQLTFEILAAISLLLKRMMDLISRLLTVLPLGLGGLVGGILGLGAKHILKTLGIVAPDNAVLCDKIITRMTGFAPNSSTTDLVLPSQRLLAEITELVHTASLLHDDVIDHSTARRGRPSANVEFGNSMAVLAGDYLLGRASMAVARLRNSEVAELFATVLTNLVQGEFMQISNTKDGEQDPVWSPDIVAYYLDKTYFKTASLISKSCRAAAVLSHGTTPATVEAAYAYGKNLGLAFQLIDDLLDYTRTDDELGKPSGADLELGLATAPLLFAWKTNPELGALIGRRFVKDGDVQRAREIVLQSDGIEQTRTLAEDYSRQAIVALGSFTDSEAKQGLVEIAMLTVQRKK